MEIADKLRKAVENNHIKDSNKPDLVYKVAVSLGVSEFREGDSEDAIIKRADDGLYKAKEGGRNCVQTVETPA